MPTANMEEIIPAARLLSRATALTHSDYERAKIAFLSGMDASGLAAQVTRRTQRTLPQHSIRAGLVHEGGLGVPQLVYVTSGDTRCTPHSQCRAPAPLCMAER